MTELMRWRSDALLRPRHELAAYISRATAVERKTWVRLGKPRALNNVIVLQLVEVASQYAFCKRVVVANFSDTVLNIAE